MKYVGICLLLLGAYLASTEYKARLERSERVLLGYLRFVSEMRSRAATCLEPPSRWVGSFVCEELEEIGFLPALRGGADLESALKSSHGVLDKDAFDVLSWLFSGGGGYLEDELRRMDGAIRALEEQREKSALSTRDRVKLFRTLAIAAAVGVAILVV